MDKYYVWFNVVFFLLALFAIRSLRTAAMFTIVIGIPLSYSLRPLILGRGKKIEEETIIDAAEKVDFDTVEEEKDTKTVNLTINLNVDTENSENVKKVINEVIDGVVKKEKVK